MHLMALGDSITAGIGLPAGALPWTAQVAAALRGWTISNAGVGGETSAMGLERLDRVQPRNPDWVSIQYGMNDHCLGPDGRNRVPPDAFERNLSAMVEAFPSSRVLLITNHFVIEGDASQYYYARHPRERYGETGANAWIAKYNAVVRRVARQYACRLADMEAAARAYPPAQFLRSLENEGVDDGVHPHVLGARVYAETILEVLKHGNGQD